MSWPDCTLASFEKLQLAADGDAQVFTWPDEGQFNRNDNWDFNDAHKDFEPLLIDKISARMMLRLHMSLNETNQRKFEEWIGKGRGHFAFMWELTEKHVRARS